jgi:hypothetical protein
LSHLSAIFWLGIFQDTFGLASNLNSPDLHILSSKYYRPEPQARGINTIISVKPMLCPPDSLVQFAVEVLAVVWSLWSEDFQSPCVP